MKSAFRFFALVAIVALSSAASAQQRTTATDTTSRKFVGAWEGTYFSDHAGENTLKLAIARDTAWKAVMEIVSEQNMPPSTVSDFKVEGTNATWTQQLMGMSCASYASLVAGTLKGEIKCGNASIGFLLRKKS